MRGRFAAALILCVAARSYGQPAEPNYEEAKKHYDAGAQAMDEGRFDDAVSEFKASYDVSQDPVVFYKIASASEKSAERSLSKAAKQTACAEAGVYYARYIDEAKPEQKFLELARAGQLRVQKLCFPETAPPAPDPNAPAPPGSEPAAPAPVPATPAVQPSKNQDRAWLFVGGSLAFVTAGAVLAYSTKSSEQDIKDLYVSNNGMPPVFTPETQERYDDLVAEGRRYQVLAWTSFAIAAGCAAGATIFFLRARNETVTVTPVVTPKETGVSATLRF
jgi:hypothetical protein